MRLIGVIYPPDDNEPSPSSLNIDQAASNSSEVAPPATDVAVEEKAVEAKASKK